MAGHTFDYDLIVIGSGASGSVAATIASRNGLRVALIEGASLGGDSSNVGDIPTQALLHTAHLYDETKQASRLGLRTNTLGYNYPSMSAWKDTVVKRSGVGDDARFYEKQGITVIRGKAHFLTPHELTVNRRHVSGRWFILATGAEWVAPTIQGLDSIPFFTPRTILTTLRPPKSLLVIGGGRYGVEIAELMAIFGTKVTIVEEKAHLLPEFDKDIGASLAGSLSAEKGIVTLTEAVVVSVAKDGFAKRVLISRGGVEKHVIVEDILVASSYAPRVDLGLENARVHFDASGVLVNEYLKTNVRHIYAAGDIIGKSRDTTASLIEGRVAVQNILNGNVALPDYASMPRSVWTSQEVAQVGLSEDEAVRTKQYIRSATAPFSVVSRSNVTDKTFGFVKLITNRQGIIVGGAIVGPRANELIQEITLAVRHKLSAKQLASTPHVFLSWAEAVRVAAQKLATGDIV